MAKFENIVRPVVFPNIRPPGRVRSVLEDSSQDDIFIEYVIRGGSGGPVDIPHSYSVNMSRQRGTETKRKVDLVRVYQKEDSGKINRENFIDVHVIKKMWKKTSGRAGTFNPTSTTAAVPAGGSADEITPEIYTGTQIADPRDNIVILKEDIIIRNPNQ